MNSTLSFLRHRRFTKKGQHRGVSLIELTIGIAILVFIIGITLLTVTNRATSVKLENYATQMTGVIKQQRIMIGRSIRQTTITPTEFANQLQNLFRGTPDIANTGGVPQITVVQGTGANACTGTATATTTTIEINTTGLSTGDLATFATVAGDAMTREFSLEVASAEIDQTFSGVKAFTGPHSATNTGLPTTVSQAITGGIRICLSD